MRGLNNTWKNLDTNLPRNLFSSNNFGHNSLNSGLSGINWKRKCSFNLRELPLMNGSSKSATIGSDWICPSPNLFHLRILLIPLNLFLYHPLIHPQTFQNKHKRTLKRLVRFYPPYGFLEKENKELAVIGMKWWLITLLKLWEIYPSIKSPVRWWRSKEKYLKIPTQGTNLIKRKVSKTFDGHLKV